MRRRRFSEDLADDDPLSLLANLFDLAIVLAVAFLLTGLGALNLAELTDPETDWTLIRRTPSGQTEVLTREGNNLQLQTLSPRKAGGQGMRLGVAYELDNGEVIYVPD